jgi:hypothetical protein
MLKVQGELNQYKYRTNEVDAQLRKDERIAVLEGSLFVFRQEALNLSKEIKLKQKALGKQTLNFSLI